MASDRYPQVDEVAQTAQPLCIPRTALRDARRQDDAYPLVVCVDEVSCAVAWVWTGARGPTVAASRARGGRRKRWRKRSKCARPNI